MKNEYVDEICGPMPFFIINGDLRKPESLKFINKFYKTFESDQEIPENETPIYKLIYNKQK